MADFVQFDLPGALNAHNVLAQQRQGMEDQNALAEAVPMLQKDPQNAFATAAARSPRAALQLLPVIQQMDKQKRADAAERAEAFGKAAMTLKGQKEPIIRKALLQSMAPQLMSYGITQEQINSFDPSDANIQAIINQSMEIKDIIGQANNERDFDRKVKEDERDFKFEGEKFGYQKENDKANRNVTIRGQNMTDARSRDATSASLENKAVSTDRRVRAEGAALRREFNNLPDVKAFNDVANSYDIISDIAKAPATAQNDMSLIFSYMKMLDPGSVVREGEFANAQNAAGVPDRILNAYNRARDGQMLNDRQRKEFTNTAKGVYESRKRRYDQVVDQYRGYAEDADLGDGVIQPRIPAGGNAAAPSTGQITATGPNGKKLRFDAPTNSWVPLK